MCLKGRYDLGKVTAGDSHEKSRETVETEWIKQGGLCKLNGDVKTEIIYILYCMGKGKYKERVSETRRGIAQRQICVSQMQDPGFCPQC